jgi:hypothetical protein
MSAMGNYILPFLENQYMAQTEKVGHDPEKSERPKGIAENGDMTLFSGIEDRIPIFNSDMIFRSCPSSFPPISDPYFLPIF